MGRINADRQELEILENPFERDFKQLLKIADFWIPLVCFEQAVRI